MPKVIIHGSQVPESIPAGLQITCPNCGAEFVTEDYEPAACIDHIEDFQTTIPGWRLPCPECGYQVFVRTDESKTIEVKIEGKYLYILHADDTTDWVNQELEPKLTATGHTVKKSSTLKIQLGVPMLNALEEVITGAHKVIIVVSPGLWEKESLRLQISLAIGMRKALPVLIQPTHIPIMTLAMLSPLDLTKTGHRLEREWDRLLRAVSS